MQNTLLAAVAISTTNFFSAAGGAIVTIALRVFKSHVFTKSPPADTNVLLSKKRVRSTSLLSGFSFITAVRLPVAKSYKNISPKYEPAASILPSGDISATNKILPTVSFIRVRNVFPVCTSSCNRPLPII